MRAARGSFGSKLGFVLAAAGSAIGLGNIWRFPYTAGENGGGAFVLIYLICVAVIGVPVLLAEVAIGRAAQRNPVGAYALLAPRSWWPAVGGAGVATGFAILAFYSVVAGWTLGYLYRTLSGQLAGALTAEQSASAFAEIISDPWASVAMTGAFLLLTVLVVRAGVSRGIERAAMILMPAFLVLLVLLAIRALTLGPGSMDGLRFLFHFDFSKVTARVVMSALGQALFSLSLGMGAMITFGSYLPRSENLHGAGISVVCFDTLIALLAGVIIFPTIFAAGGNPAAGPGLVFVTMPSVLGTLPAGQLIAFAFYGLLAIAALTSTISLLEVVVSYFIDQRGWSREAACWVVGASCFLLAIPSSLASGAVPGLSEGEGSWLPGGIDFLSLQNIIFGNYALALGALLICLFIGWKWGVAAATEEIERGGEQFPGARAWSFLIRYVCPLAVGAILVFIVVTRQYF